MDTIDKGAAIRKKTAIIAGLVVVLVAGFLITHKKQQSGDNSLLMSTIPASSANIPADWTVISDSQNSFSLRIPPTAKSSLNGQTLSILYSSSAPIEDSQTNSGYMITAYSQDDPNNNQALRKLISSQGEGTSVSNVNGQMVQKINIGGHEGLLYSEEKAGQFKTIVLPAGDNKSVVVSYAVADPQNAGYQQIVDQILSSLQLM